MMISEEGKKALFEWAKVRDYTIPSVTLLFEKEVMEKVYKIAFGEKIIYNHGIIVGKSIEVPVALVSVFIHLSPKVIDDAEKEAMRKGRGRRKIMTGEEAKATMAQQIRKWQKKNKDGDE